MGDTAYWYKYAKELEEKIELTDFEKTTSKFSFRFRNYGQVVEIIKDSTNISGSVTNYLYYRRKENSERKTLFRKEFLSEAQAKNIYEIVQNAEISELPSDKDIKNWSQGFDGITYIFECADKSTYSFKNYWSPEGQKIPEAARIQKFINVLKDTLNLAEDYERFEVNLPKRTGFYDVGSISTRYSIYSTTYLGYSGATKLPLGFFAAHYTSYLGNKEVNVGGLVQYNFDSNGFYYLSLRASKSVLFFKEEKLRDFAFYSYQNRKLNIKSINSHLQNHQFLYGLYFDNFGVGAGFDYLKEKTIDKTGILIYADRYFKKLNLSTTIYSSIFNNQINYKIDIERNFNLGDRSPIDNISLGLGYEDFMNYKDVYFMILTRF
ncbi:hypothetical protein SAMN02927937_02348 [Paenimyroides aquimaris]|uniref:Uncharacterized protein n=1 Tax=Paenimyroides marinum TaxID=1159016 RepID=A0A1H6M284_9FLAO|nr:hypothetical protein [Paenimyroides aquimaris]SEH95309.1 hypothetical protein SAMN02927937_02348 [Paenimyroides aquimaris]